MYRSQKTNELRQHAGIDARQAVKEKKKCEFQIKFQWRSRAINGIIKHFCHHSIYSTLFKPGGAKSSRKTHCIDATRAKSDKISTVALWKIYSISIGCAEAKCCDFISHLMKQQSLVLNEREKIIQGKILQSCRMCWSQQSHLILLYMLFDKCPLNYLSANF